MDDVEQYKQYLVSTGVHPDEANAYGEYLKGHAQPTAPAQQDPLWKTALHTTGRVLDYPGGLARTGIAQLADMPSESGPGTVTGEDWKNALKGQAPNSAEYMKRMGVGTGDVVNYPLIGPTSTRDIAGFALDVATDPLTLVSKLKGPLGGMNYANEAADAAGKGMVKSGVKKIDQALVEKGAEPLSNILIEHGISGNSGQIRGASEQILNNTKAARDEMHATADAAGAVIDPRVAFKDALDKAVNLGQRDPGMADLAQKLEEKIGKYVEYGPVPLSQASEWKTNLYNALPESAYDKFGKLKGPADKIQKSMASGLKNAIEETGNATVPGLGDQIGQANETMQTLLAARKPLKTAAKAEKSVNAITSVDAMLAGGGMLASHDPMTTAALLAAKKAGDISKTTRFRTGAGQALIGVGQNPLTTPAVNRSLIDSPWMKMQQQNGGQ